MTLYRLKPFTPPALNRLQPRRRLLVAGAAGLVLAHVTRPARACEFWTSTLRVNHPWTLATADDATEARMFMVLDEVQHEDRLIGVETPVASGAALAGLRELGHVDLPIPKGRATRLSPAGTWIRLTGLVQPMELGRSYPLRLHFQRSGSVRAELTVDMADAGPSDAAGHAHPHSESATDHEPHDEHTAT